MKYWGIPLLFSLFVPAWGQSFEDLALMFSRQQPQSSARVMGMGGVQVGVGGDFSNAAANPAGLAFFNRGEIAGSLSSSTFSASGLYEGETTKAGSTRLAIPSLGFVFSHGARNDNWISGTFAVTLSRMADHNQVFKYQGQNSNSSIVDYFAFVSEDNEPSDLGVLEGLGYENYLTDIKSSNPIDYAAFWETGVNDPGFPRILQKESIEYAGSQSQWSASYAANIKDVVYLGVSLHLRNVKFESTKKFQELDFIYEEDLDFNPLDNFVLTEELVLSGSGVAATLGAMVRPVDWLRVGISYNTPTAYTVNDTYVASLKSDWNNFDYFEDGSEILNNVEAESEEIISDYRLRTPGKLSGGVAFFINKRGFFSLEGDLVNYGKANYKSKTDGLDFDVDNESINNLYRTAASLRAGGELRFQNWRVRGGYGYQSNPFKTGQTDYSQALNTYSLGGGYRTTEYYVDAAFTLTQGQSGYRPYSFNSVNDPLVKFTNSRTLVTVTVGFLLN